MYTIHRILVSTDFSDYSLSAMEYAVSVARQFDADIHLLHVVEGTAREEEGNSRNTVEPSNRLVRVQEQLQQLTRNQLAGVRNVVCVVRRGVPDAEIVRYGQEHGADLIVIATHGRTGLGHVLIGSIAEKVVRRSPIPVMAVKPPAVLEQLITAGDIESELHLRETSL